MLIVTIQGDNYKIAFKRQVVSSRYKGRGPRRTMETVCKITRERSAVSTIVAMGSVRCHHQDQDIKRVGYKRALTKALADGAFCKVHRSVIWHGLSQLYAKKAK